MNVFFRCIAAILFLTPLPVRALGYKELSAVRTRALGADVFLIDSDDTVKHVWQTDKAGSFGGSEDLGGTARDIAAIELAAGRFEVFVIGSDDAVWRNWQKPNRTWAGWESLGGVAKRLAVVKNKAGRCEVFAIGSDAALWHLWRAGPNAKWSEWESLGGEIQQLSAADAGSGKFVVFAVGRDNAVWRSDVPGHEWQSLGGEAHDIALARLASGAFQVAVVGSDSSVWQIRQGQPNAAFGEWESLNTAAQRVALSPARPSGVELFILGPDAGLTRMTASTPAPAPSKAKTKTSTPNPPATWTPSKKIAEVSPLDTTFTGEATVAIPDLHVSESRKVTLGIRFSADRSKVEITSFPPIETKRYDTPFGKSKSKVTLVHGGNGSFDAAAGQISIAVTLHFDQSLDVAVVSEDADAALELRTDAEGGAPLDRETGRVKLAASGKFEGRGSVNPLRGKTCHALIAGTIEPVPAQAAKKK